jgi:hypothetical protein
MRKLQQQTSLMEQWFTDWRVCINPSRTQSQSQSYTYFTTGGLPPISLSWRQTPGDSRSVIFSTEHLWSLCNILSDEMSLSLTTDAGPHQRSQSLWREDGFVSYGHAWPFVKYTYCTYRMLLKILRCALSANHVSVQTLKSRSCLSYVSYATTTQLSHLSGRKLDHRQV